MNLHVCKLLIKKVMDVHKSNPLHPKRPIVALTASP